MKTFGKIIAAIVVLVPLLTFGWLSYSTQKNLATPGQDALAALAGDETVRIESGDWLILRPGTSTPTVGLILYPGANCDIRGYAPVLRKIAAQGYLVVTVSMPFDFAIFAPDRADEVIAAFPDISQWVVVGHSMGGAMAARYAFNHQDELAGLIVWDSYPPGSNSLADSELPVLHIHRATPAGQPPQKFQDMRGLFPDDSRWVAIPGGQHMYFGSFIGGGYQEEWPAGIARDAQHAIVINAMLDGLATMTSRSARMSL